MKKIRGKFKKEKDLKYIGHLDLMRLFDRTFRRANIPIKYSEGFNPQPKFSFATALPLGVESHGEYFDLELEKEIAIDEFVENMNNTLPKAIRVLKAVYTDDKKSIMSLIRWSTYIIKIVLTNEISENDLHSAISDFLAKNDIIITKEKIKKGKKTQREIDIREFIKNIELFNHTDNIVVLKTTLKTGSTGNLKPEDLINALDMYTNIEIEKDKTRIQRLELFIENDNKIIAPI